MSLEWWSNNDIQPNLESEKNNESNEINHLDLQEKIEKQKNLKQSESIDKTEEESEINMIESFFDSWFDNIEEISKKISNKASEVKNEVSEKINEVKENINEKVTEIKKTVNEKIDELSTNVSSTIMEVKQKAKDILENKTEIVSESEKAELIENAKLANLAYEDFNIWDKVEWWYTVDSKISTESWFDAVSFIDSEWNKTIAIRWTEPDQVEDLLADWSLILNNLPLDQVIDMIHFFDENTKDWKLINITWHSLWWALTQAITAMIPNKINTSYTYNAPWVKNLDIDIKWINERTDISESDRLRILELAATFMTNRKKENIWDLVKNVEWTSWLNLIAWLNEDIWKHYYIPDSVDHSVAKLPNAMKDVVITKQVSDSKKDKINS